MNGRTIALVSDYGLLTAALTTQLQTSDARLLLLSDAIEEVKAEPASSWVVWDEQEVKATPDYDRTDPYAKRVGTRVSTACQQARGRNKAKTRAAKQARKRNRR